MNYSINGYQYSMQNTTYYLSQYMKLGILGCSQSKQKKAVESNSGRSVMSFNVFIRSSSKR